MKCVILAGGFGTRLPEALREIPKALLRYRGKPVLTAIIEKIPEDIEIFVSTNLKFQKDLEQWKRSISRPLTLCIEESRDETEKSGAVSALNHWVIEKQIGEDLLVIAGDNYFEFELNDFISAFNGSDTLIAVHDTGNLETATHFGVVDLEGGKIVRLNEKPPEPRSSLVATAIYLFPRRGLEILNEYCREGRKDNLGAFITHLIQNTEQVSAYVSAQKWLDIGVWLK